MWLMSRSRSVVLGVGFALAASTLTSAFKPAATESNAAAAAPASVQAPAPATSKPPLREPDVIYVPTPQNVVDAMLKMANVKASDVVYDLGSGDGRIPITAAQKYGARAIGIDINPQRIKEANENLAKAMG